MGRQELTASLSLRGTQRVAACLATALAAATFTLSPADARHATRHTVHSESVSAPYSAIVVDANSGAALHAASADELRHPASLTKIMTLYLLFERLEAGKLRLDSPLEVSAHAASQAPTKLGLHSGATIEVEDAIKALVTQSANDAAVVIAEAIGGGEHDFAEMMTRKAHALGMSRTVYRNASGLPDDEQVTSARDQALLGRAIQERFPRHYRYFATPSFTYHGVSMRNHNHLLGNVEGLDGIKTGYTQASGFNLVTSVRRDGRHIVAVVMGGSSAGARDARMRSLIESYIVAASTHQSATAIADALSAKDVRTADAKPVETKPVEKQTEAVRDARTPNKAPPPAVYAVASYTRPIPWPVPQANTAAIAPAAPSEAKPPTLVVAQTKPTAVREPARLPSPDDPIRPIAVKTVKAKLAPSQVAALAPPAAPPSAMPQAAPAASPVVTDVTPPVPAPQPERLPDRPAAGATNVMAAKAAALMPIPDPTAVRREVSREVWREPVLEVARDAAPSAPAVPQTTALQETAPPTTQLASLQAAPSGAATRQHSPIHSAPPPAVHSGWIIQVGAYEAEREAREKLSAVQTKAGSLLSRADPFTEPVVRGDKTYYRARFAGLQKDDAETVCRQLKRNDIDCMTIRN